MDESGTTRISKISSHTCACIGFWLSSLFSVVVVVFLISSSSLLKLIFFFCMIDAIELFFIANLLFFFVLFMVLVEIKQCLNFQCWTIKIIKNSGVLFYFISLFFLTKKPFSVTNSVRWIKCAMMRKNLLFSIAFLFAFT